MRLELPRGVRGTPDVGISGSCHLEVAFPGRGAHEPKKMGSLSQARRIRDSNVLLSIRLLPG